MHNLGSSEARRAECKTKRLQHFWPDGASHSLTWFFGLKIFLVRLLKNSEHFSKQFVNLLFLVTLMGMKGSCVETARSLRLAGC